MTPIFIDLWDYSSLP